MAAGFQSLHAFWVGGAGVPPAAAAAGTRSMLAPWVGGAGAFPQPEQAGYGSLLCWWVGGAGSSFVEPPVPPPAQPPVVGGIRLPIPPDLAARLRRRQIQEDELIALVLLAALPGLLHRH